MVVFRNIEAERVRYGLNVSELCELLGISKPTYRSWIRGETSIPSDSLLKMSLLWNTSTDVLLTPYKESKGLEKAEDPGALQTRKEKIL